MTRRGCLVPTKPGTETLLARTARLPRVDGELFGPVDDLTELFTGSDGSSFASVALAGTNRGCLRPSGRSAASAGAAGRRHARPGRGGGLAAHRCTISRRSRGRTARRDARFRCRWAHTSFPHGNRQPAPGRSGSSPTPSQRGSLRSYSCIGSSPSRAAARADESALRQERKRKLTTAQIARDER